MLVVFYCNSKDCKHIHLRTDERDKSEHAVCPKCGRKMIFISDFLGWTRCSEIKRKELLKEHLIVSYDVNEKGKIRKSVHIRQIRNYQVYYDYKRSQQDRSRLEEENEMLRIMADDYEESYSRWKKRGIIYHDELWSILSYYEPEKYNRN